ncbi:type II secretion system F family protein [Paenibacillus athensensis]|uniref:Pilus assembly protein TadB n=1 Tax=Paenibacillus athensensis TaxID=1967502 RepID=A0A4Y8Q8N4_9BACL|nr:type II secretion system F family protein [Paenibacillus athensensis]MCD1260377.1 type II secretion system F family protein [Paenibacillus athensensis]
MTIILIALAAGVVIWLLFRLSDRKRQHVGDPGEVDQAKPQRRPAVVQETNGEALTDYSVYTLSARERIEALIVGCLLYFALGYLFYNNLILACVAASLGLLNPRARRRKLLEKRKNELNDQFKQALYSLSSSLGAGRSVENAFQETIKDLQLLYPDPRTYILREFGVIVHRIENGEPIERALADFGARSDLEDIQNFADVFISCKRTGGDLVEIIRRTSNIIGDKLDIQQEIAVMVAQKRFESKALSVAPIVIVAFLSLSSPDYMAPLHSGAGYLLMTAALLVLLGCYWFTQRIMNIRV